MVDHYETVRQRKDGARLSISLTVSPIRNDAGEIVGASKIARDITERARLLAAAREHAANTRKARRSRRGRRVDARPRRHRPEGHRHRDRADAARSSARSSTTSTIRSPATPTCCTRCPARREEAFAKFPQPRATAVFAPTFRGEGAVRLDDVTQDPRYGKSPPYFGMPPGHLPVRSYLAVPVKGWSRRRARRAVLRPFAGGRVHRAARAAGDGHGGVGVGGARERPAVRRSAGRQPDEGRVPRRALARAAHAAQRDRRLRAPAARRHPAGEKARARPRDARTQRDVADADRRRRARRLADRLGQDPAGRPARGAAAHRGQRRGDGPAGRRRQGRAAADHRRSRASDPSPAIPIACSRSSGISCRTP